MNISEAINQQQIDEWKAQYGKIFKTMIGDQAVIWRKLKRREYVEAMSQESPDGLSGSKIYARQEFIVNAVVLYPENIAEMVEDNAGIATCVSDEVILRSGFDLTTTEEL